MPFLHALSSCPEWCDGRSPDGEPADAETSDRVPPPEPRNITMSVFTELPDDLVAALAVQGITEPPPLQTAGLPDAPARYDALGRARTGSGKTLAFGLPILARLAGR